LLLLVLLNFNFNYFNDFLNELQFPVIIWLLLLVLSFKQTLY
jgi:hypothetical protein